MNKFAEDVWQQFSGNPFPYEKKAFERYVAPYLKEPDQQVIDNQAFHDWYHTGSSAYDAESQGSCYSRFKSVWHAALKWERGRENGL